MQSEDASSASYPCGSHTCICSRYLVLATPAQLDFMPHLLGKLIVPVPVCQSSTSALCRILKVGMQGADRYSTLI